MRLAPLLAVALMTLAVPLAGCGFTPLYAQGATTAQMSAIDVEVDDARTGYLLRERLDDELGRDRAKQPAYRLEVTVAETRDPRGLGLDNTASRYELRVTADYALFAAGGTEALTRGKHEVLITYEAVDPPYAGIAAQQDSQQRAAAEAARRIRLDIAKYFASSRT